MHNGIYDNRFANCASVASVVLTAWFVAVGISGAFAEPTNAIITKSTAISPVDKIRVVAKAALTNANMPGVSYEGVQSVAYDDPDADVKSSSSMWDAPVEKAPAGALDIAVYYHISNEPVDDSQVANFATSLFQKAFAQNPLIWRVAVNFNGPTSDDYGHRNEGVYIGYMTYRPTFKKIDWKGFDTSSLCSFLRKTARSDLAQDGDPKGGDSCTLMPEISTQ